MEEEPNKFVRFIKSVYDIIDKPVVYFRENIVVANQKKYPWYHQQFRRVPTIDECYELDMACRVEAELQFQRDWLVDQEILYVTRLRQEDCFMENPENHELCDEIVKTHQDALTAYQVKYGDLGIKCNAINAFMKQKHRMIWERRHGPVGTGTKF
ncbi:NADH dehydrogenase [ubiquinone] 1 beta subcomplex subunit 10 [Colletes gigas]|uniref:NADH dehydrogenase [ubiquinone] 1 beta subcomplex subunit 10 n=1 Tax=Colletes gigas TaxID=935657 RepID=UPI001C9A3A1A|nr:NADH dehydrogenase [ubiquinone] 1 beta subcomplex subunit 10 [Colletes gigas]